MTSKKALNKHAQPVSARALACIAFAAQLLVSGCAAPSPVHGTDAASAETAHPTITQTSGTLVPEPTPVSSPSPLPTLTQPVIATKAAFKVCSPLEGISLEELGQPDLLKNPFQMPRPGMDDGHHGADFAYWTRGERTTMQGLPVYSILAGRVAGIIENRLPYGNAVIVETPLRVLPETFIAALALPAPQPTVQPAPSLYCPPDTRTYGDPAQQSVYLLYAHLDQTPLVGVGDAVACGSPLGVVGTTGKSVNYHLHLEARAGPSGSDFPSFAHYDTAATAEEMSAYCTWRVSGLFQMFDPLALFNASPLEKSLQP